MIIDAARLHAVRALVLPMYIWPSGYLNNLLVVADAGKLGASRCLDCRVEDCVLQIQGLIEKTGRNLHLGYLKTLLPPVLR